MILVVHIVVVYIMLILLGAIAVVQLLILR